MLTQAAVGLSFSVSILPHLLEVPILAIVGNELIQMCDRLIDLTDLLISPSPGISESSPSSERLLRFG